jgi:hypothetical protein
MRMNVQHFTIASQLPKTREEGRGLAGGSRLLDTERSCRSLVTKATADNSCHGARAFYSSDARDFYSSELKPAETTHMRNYDNGEGRK